MAEKTGNVPVSLWLPLEARAILNKLVWARQAAGGKRVTQGQVVADLLMATKEKMEMVK